ncbi:hypothetical protein EYF80_024874 [Liparis tanakae]|uniref:Uncharacterized protein n=1 Tax=Liparis tanakae TaxID=230148 RepID=A0A4Z2HGM2_9TELE|nr:hypothetical protein EYF80_024874 [Liparis tanakae]
MGSQEAGDVVECRSSTTASERKDNKQTNKRCSYKGPRKTQSPANKIHRTASPKLTNWDARQARGPPDGAATKGLAVMSSRASQKAPEWQRRRP